MIYVLIGALILVVVYAFVLRRRVHDLKYQDFTRRMSGRDAMADIRNTRLDAEKLMRDVGMHLPNRSRQ